jgi:predicted ATPase/class 3 adenylate cyclase
MTCVTRRPIYAPRITELPSGTVTLLFTDIEGSTQLLKRLGDAYGELLEKHAVLVRSAIAKHRGVELSTEGDSFFVVFRTASDAIAAALAAQRALGHHAWPPEGMVRVRMGVHTGPIRIAGENYVGMTVHEAARIAAAAHGGQTIVSEASVDAGEPPPGSSLRSVGTHRLKDIDEEMRLFQLCHPDLDDDFPALRSLGPPAGALPSFASTFVGRAAEQVSLAAIARDRIVTTIVGAPGVGKTRLAIEVAREVGADRRAGARFVALGATTGSSSVADDVRRALGIREPIDGSSAEAVAGHLAATDTLLVIDNCEHVADGVARLVGHLVSACPRVRLLLTSRAPLDVDGETVWQLQPLTEAAHLFVERASRARPGVSTSHDDPYVLAICERLDGLPLAIELAAAQTRRMSVAEIAHELGDRLDLLDRPSRTGEQRHASLSDAIRWSYELLDDRQAEALRRLGVFQGAFDAAAAAAILDLPDVRRVLDQLVDRSLVAPDDGGVHRRFRLLATIRSFARARLDDSETSTIALASHARHFREVMRQTDAEVSELTTLNAISFDQEEHRAALAWYSQHDPAEGLRYAVDLDVYWSTRAAPGDGTEILERFLAAVPETNERVRSTALAILADGHRREGRFAAARHCAEQAMEVDVRAGADRGQVSARLVLGQILAMQGEPAEATALIEANLDDATTSGNTPEIVMSLRLLVSLALDRGDTTAARRLLDTAWARASGLGDTWMTGPLLSDSADLALLEGRLDEARRLMQETLELAQRFGDVNAAAECMRSLARIARHEGALAEALVLLSEAGHVYVSQCDLGGFAHVLTERAMAASAEGDHERVGLLLGGQANVRGRVGLATPLREVGDIASATASATHALGAESFAAAWSRGSASTVAALLEQVDSGSPARGDSLW